MNSNHAFPQRQLSRLETWVHLLMNPAYFRRWTQSEYRDRVKELCASHAVAFQDVKRTGRLNDTARLYIEGITMPTIGRQIDVQRDSA